uniref:ABC transporter, ATP-binding protein n=1 Tax=uncultured organism TaxID=155900 RepID=M1PUW4_9ZZZZ|nr:ABC transporter, ATP-binding protein [uncultured organism]
MKNTIEVNELKKYYGDVKAVDGITFSVDEGEIFGMLGPNGAGKTTTIETVIGLIERTSGDISVLGMEPNTELPTIKKKIGVQLQNPSLFPRLTVKETLELFASFYPEPLDVKEAANQVDIEEAFNTSVESLSGGQKHRLAVALSLVSNGKIIFLDEPTTGLDPKARRDLWDTITNLQKRDITVFLTTHYMDEAEKLCDHLVIIDMGKIIARGSPEQLINKYFPRRAIEFTDPGLDQEEREELAKLNFKGDLSFDEGESRVILYSENVAETFDELFDFTQKIDKPLNDVSVRTATLDDVFLKLTGRGIEEDE